MKAILFTDTHANFPALKAFLQFAEREGYDLLVHLGDVVAIGPQPAECLETLLALEKIVFLCGNHDDWLVNGLPQPRPAWLSDGELEHQKWTHAQITAEMVSTVANWPWKLSQDWAGLAVDLLHYPLTADPTIFKKIVKEQSSSALDALFAEHGAPLIFYGHHHPFSDVTGRSRYINPGSLGCHTLPLARCTIATCQNGQATIKHHAIPYDDSGLGKVFTARKVPDRQLLNQYFFGGRLHL